MLSLDLSLFDPLQCYLSPDTTFANELPLELGMEVRRNTKQSWRAYFLIT